jgi:4-azaleucine resistance transporter AzlC
MTISNTSTFASGARAGLPVVLGYLGIGLAAGVVERAAGLSYAEVLLISTVLYAGSAQFVVTSMLSLASPAAAIVLTVFFLNLRHLLLSAALAPALRHVPAWQNALIGLQLTDETFVVAANRPPGETRLQPAWMAGLNLAAWTTWAMANLAGAALSSSIGDTRVLAFALPCMFAGLLVLQINTMSSRMVPIVVAIISGGAALAIHSVFPGPWAIIGATVAGATLGLGLQRWRSVQSS